jgi:hypothetical protein
MNHAQLVEWKDRYGAVHILPVEEHTCYYRGLTISEHQTLVELTDKIDNLAWEELVIQKGLLQPAYEDLNFELAGSISSLATAILDQTLWDEATFKQQATEAREWAKKYTDNSLLYTMAVAVSNMFPGLRLDYLINLPPVKLMRLMAVAEIGTQIPIFDTLLGTGPKNMGIDTGKAQAAGVTPQQLDAANQELLRSIEEHKNKLK